MATLTENMARLGHKTLNAALHYQHSQDGRDPIVAANLSANAVAELEAATGKFGPGPTCKGVDDPALYDPAPQFRVSLAE